MIPAKCTNQIDNLIHLPEWHAAHQLVEFVEVRLYLLVIIRAAPESTTGWKGLSIRMGAFPAP